MKSRKYWEDNREALREYNTAYVAARRAGKRWKFPRRRLSKRHMPYCGYSDKLEYQRAASRRSVHGISMDEGCVVESIDRCYICDVPVSGKNKCLDHCHQSGDIRGVLCRKCNVGIGMFDDSVERMLSAVEYLRQPPGVELLRDKKDLDSGEKNQ